MLNSNIKREVGNTAKEVRVDIETAREFAILVIDEVAKLAKEDLASFQKIKLVLL